jgi:transcription termination factor Rho
VADDLAARYGGAPGDWVKISSTTYNTGRGGIYDTFETYRYQNIRTGERVEFKTRFPKAEAGYTKPA